MKNTVKILFLIVLFACQQTQEKKDLSLEPISKIRNSTSTIIPAISSSARIESAVSTIIPAILPRGTITSSTGSTDYFKTKNGGLSNKTITLKNYLTVQELSWNNNKSWVTVSSGTDYYSLGVLPILTIDFGSIQTLNSILVWGYLPSSKKISQNMAKIFNLEIFDSAKGEFIEVETGLDLEKFNAAIAFPNATAVKVTLSKAYTTNKVRLTITDNYASFSHLKYIGAGGDRVGIGELAFANLKK